MITDCRLHRIQLLKGAKILTLTQAISVLNQYDPSSFLKWSGDFRNGSFSFQYSAYGQMGMAWSPESLVAVAWDRNSERNAAASDDFDEELYEKDHFLKGISGQHIANLEAAYHAMINVREFSNEDLNITAGLWIEGEQQTHLAEDLEIARKNGLGWIERITLGQKEGAWSLTNDQMKLVESCAQKILFLSENEKIVLPVNELKSVMTCNPSQQANRITICQDYLLKIGIQSDSNFADRCST